MKIAFPELLDELNEYSSNQSFKYKVQIVINKCILSGRIGLADKISEKYRHLLPKSDLVMAFGMGLLASQQKFK